MRFQSVSGLRWVIKALRKGKKDVQSSGPARNKNKNRVVIGNVLRECTVCVSVRKHRERGRVWDCTFTGSSHFHRPRETGLRSFCHWHALPCSRDYHKRQRYYLLVDDFRVKREGELIVHSPNREAIGNGTS